MLTLGQTLKVRLRWQSSAETEDAEPIRHVFLCTAIEVLLIEMEIFPVGALKRNQMLDAYVRACEVKLKLSE